MHRIVFGIVLLANWLAATPAFPAEPLVVDVWPGKVPGDIGIKSQETSRIHESPLVGPTKLITNLTKPTLTIYQPPKEKSRFRLGAIWRSPRRPASRRFTRGREVLRLLGLLCLTTWHSLN